MAWREQPELKTIVQALGRHGLRRTLSPRQALVSALEKLKHKPLETVFFVLLSFEIVRYDLNHVRYLLDSLRHDLQLEGAAPSIPEVPSGLSVVDYALPVVLDMLGTANSRLRAPKLSRGCLMWQALSTKCEAQNVHFIWRSGRCWRGSATAPYLTILSGVSSFETE